MPLTDFVQEEHFEAYQSRFKQHFVVLRSDEGVLEARMHTNGGPAVWSMELHRAMGQFFETVARDRNNQILILTGTGEYWLKGIDTESFAAIDGTDESFKENGYEAWYRDGRRLLEKLVWDCDMPTIACFNGPGIHSEVPLLCDLTLSSDDAYFFDPHVAAGLAPGDGQFLIFQQLLGLKRANFAALFGERIQAKAALEFGLVNEVMPRDQLMPRAHELAKKLLKMDPTLRRVTTQLLRRPWRKLLTEDLEMHFAHEMFQAHVHRLPRGGR